MDNPEADSGHFCIYGFASEVTVGTLDPATFNPGTGVYGTLLTFTVTGPAPVASGTWAVTG
jgi:hypothetical protein